MNKILSNRSFSAEITPAGAELISFKKIADHGEYIWKGDPQFWTGHSPILFPIVGSLNNGETRIAGNVYKLSNHGFARRSEFELIEESEDRALFRLSSNETTLTLYPFKFNLDLIYTLSENQLKVEYHVENVDDQTIYFQIGTHPAFNCPLDHNTNFKDYYLEFDCAEKVSRFYTNSANLIINGKPEALELKDNRILPLNHEMFHTGAIVLKNVQSKKVTLKSDRTTKKVILTYENLPHMGIWQAKNAPFICMEPWHGLTETEGFNVEFQEKEAIVSLKKDARFSCSYMIEVF